MAYTSLGSSSSSDSEVDSCSKSCVKAYGTLKEQYDSLSSDYKKSQFNLVSYKAGLQSVQDRLVYYKKNEAVFEESINVLKLEVRLRDNALNEYKMNLEKFKTGLGYNAAIAATPAVESFVNLTDKSGSDKGYQSVPPPLSGNFIPRKPDLTFIDEIVKSENLDVTTVVTPCNDKTVENKGVSNTVESNAIRMNNTSAPIIEDWNSDNESEIDYTVVRKVWNNSRRVNHKNFTNKITHPRPKRSFVPQAVLTRSGKLSTADATVNTVRPVNTANIKAVNTVRPVNTAASKPYMNHPRTKTNAFKRGYSQSSRLFKRHFANKNSIINTNVNIASQELMKRHEISSTSVRCVKQLGKSKEVGTPRYLSLVVPLKKVGDEAIHKELGDRMERDSTTATSLEAEQDSGSGPRCQDTILGDVDAQTRHQLVLPVHVPAAEESNGFAEIIDFLKASSVHYALTVNPIIYTSCIQQFWAIANVKMVNGVRQLQALNKKQKMIITESSIRSDLHLEDAEASEEVGEDSDHLTDSNQIPIVHQPSTSSQPKKKQQSKRKQRKEAEVLDLEKAKSDQAIEIASLKKRVNNLEKRRKFRTTWLKRLKKVGASRRIESSNDSLGAQEDASKQGRRIEDIDADAKVTLVNETQERQDEDLMFDTRVLDDDEVFVDVTTIEKEEQSTKTSESVSTGGVEDSATPTIPTTVEETLAQTLMEIKAAKPKSKGIVFHDQEEQVTMSIVSIPQPLIKDKAKGIMLEPERPLKRKYQVALDEQMARDLQAQLEAELIE
ncbi:hypothetical protein Tco_0882130 [Tanacetum coccineum]